MPETMVDIMVKTEEHRSLQEDSNGAKKCDENGWDDFYKCYFDTLATTMKYKCYLPFLLGKPKMFEKLENCTKFGEGYDFAK